MAVLLKSRTTVTLSRPPSLPSFLLLLVNDEMQKWYRSVLKKDIDAVNRLKRRRAGQDSPYGHGDAGNLLLSSDIRIQPTLPFIALESYVTSLVLQWS